MRFSTSALVIVLLQNSSLLSPNDAFSPPFSLIKQSSSSSITSLHKNDALFARQNDEQNELDDNNYNDGGNNDDKSRIVSSMLVGGAALQLSTSKVSAECFCAQHTYHHRFMCSPSLLTLFVRYIQLHYIHIGISRRKCIIRYNFWSITRQQRQRW